MPPLPQTSREIRLTTVPDGLPNPEHFVVAEVPLPVPDDGQVLVRNRFFHVFAALRTLIGGSVEGTPVPPLCPGDTLLGAHGAGPPGTGLAGRPVEPLGHETLAPLRRRLAGGAQVTADLADARHGAVLAGVRAGQDDPRTQGHVLRGRAPRPHRSSSARSSAVGSSGASLGPDATWESSRWI